MDQDDCSMDEGDLLQIKKESGDADVDIGFAILQPTNLHYRNNKQDVSVVKLEKEIDERNADATLCSGVKQECNEVELTSVDELKCAGATSTPRVAGNEKQAISIQVEGTNLVIMPRVLLSCCEETNQQDVSVVKLENEIDERNADATLCSGVKQECNEVELTSVDELKCAGATSTPRAAGNEKQAISIQVEGTNLVIMPRVLLSCCEEINQNIDKTENVVAEVENMVAEVENVVAEVENVVAEADDVVVKEEIVIVEEENMVIEVENAVTHDGGDPSQLGRMEKESAKDTCTEPDHIKPIYICDHCCWIFVKKEAIEAHIKSKHAANFRKCDQCENSFVKEHNLAKHKARVHNVPMEDLKNCDICDAPVKVTILERHMQSMHSDEQLLCNVCGEIITSKYLFRQHSRLLAAVTVSNLSNDAMTSDEQGRSEVYSCGKCVQIFNSKKTLNRHCLRKHSAETPKQNERNDKFRLESYLRIRNTPDGTAQYECSVCEKIYKSEECLRDHVLDIHRNFTAVSGSIIYYKCDGCGMWCVEKLKILDHTLLKHSNASYKCEICKKHMYCKTYLKRHMVRAHITLTNKCNVCGDAVSLRKMEHHMLTMHSDMKLKCKVCGVTMEKWLLHTHMKDFHGQHSADAEPDVYICDYCQKIFASKLKIIDHINCTHGSGSYKCNLCDKSFRCEKYLTSHRANIHFPHMQECKVCGKFLRPRNLKPHMLNMHSGKKLQCKVCGEVMTSKLYLHQHMNDIHGQQSIASPFVNRCGYCKKIYSSKKNLNVHVRNLHGEVVHRCSECRVVFRSEVSLQSHIELTHSKEEHEERNRQPTCNNFGESRESKPPTVSELNAAAGTNTQQHDAVTMKDEPRADEELELGPIVFQHMDCNYRPYNAE